MIMSHVETKEQMLAALNKNERDQIRALLAKIVNPVGVTNYLLMHLFYYVNSGVRGSPIKGDGHWFTF